MRSTQLTLWIADLSAGNGEARLALRDGRELTSRALREGLIEPGENGAASLAQAFAEALEDEWLTCNYESWPNDREIPPRFGFRQHHLQRCRNIRITRTGWQSIPALREALSAKPSAPSSSLAMPQKSMDIFICHATEDKEEVARPITERLEEAGWQVWFDDFELRLGDRLRAGIDSGLSRSRYGAVILSPHFLARKPWTEHELDGLMSREVAGGGAKVILPIWHNVGFEQINDYSSALAGRLASSTAQGLDKVIADLDFVLRNGDERRPRRRGSDSPIALPRPAAEVPADRTPSERLPQSSIAAARAESVAMAQTLIDEAAHKAADVPKIVREALYQYFHDRRPLTVGGSGDAFTVLDAKAAVEHGYLDWDDDQPQALTLRHEQPTVAEVESALRSVRQSVFNGVVFEGKAEAGEWVRPLLKDRYEIADPTFELRPVWHALGLL